MNFPMKFHLVKIKVTNQYLELTKVLSTKNYKNRMKKILKIWISVLLLSIFSASILDAQNIIKRPNPPRLVNDFTGTLSNAQINNLERKLVDFSNSTSNQITVVFVNSFEGYDKAEYASLLGHQWKVGQKKFDNGIVILVKPKKGRVRGEAFIATGYGLEGAIPDAIAKRIIENEMFPEFKTGNYFAGIDKAANVLMNLAKGEYSSSEYKKRTEQVPYAGMVPIIIIALIFLLMRVGRARSHSVGHGVPFWTALWLAGSMGGHRSHSGSWNSFSSGSGSFGGGSSFGGFGGGGFGGGGAGGSW